MSNALRKVLCYDVTLFVAFVLYVWVDTKRLGPLGTLLLLGLVWLAVAGSKLLKKHIAALTRKERKIRFGVSSICFVTLFGLVVLWAVKNGTAAAWGFASLGLMILAALYYAEWDRLNDDLKQMPVDEAQR